MSISFLTRCAVIASIVSAAACLGDGNQSSIQAATIYIDISGDDAPMPDSMGRYWNSTPENAPASPAYLVNNAFDSTNAPTPVDLNLLTPSTTGFSTASIQTGKTGSTITNWDNAVTHDNWSVQSGFTPQLRIEGLLPGFSYDLLFYAGRDIMGQNRTTQISINTMNQQFDATNEGLTTFTNIQSDANGDILFSVSAFTGANFGHLGAVQITGTFVLPPPALPAPEPSSVVLLLGMAGIAAMRRRATARS